MMLRMKDMKKLFTDSQMKLDRLLQDPGYTIEYIKAQWARQRECQLKAIDTGSMKALTEKVAHLVGLEENLYESQQELRELRRQRRHIRSEANEERIMCLPNSLTLIEEEINSVISELGAEEFRNIPGAASAHGKSVIRIRVSKGRLYEAKVGVLEESKQANLRAAYERQVSGHNKSFPRKQIECPEFEDMKSLPIDDSFWDFGHLTHPEEPWATDSRLQDGIKWYLEVTHSKDELRRVGRECRQSMNWAIETNKKISDLKNIVYSNDDTLENENNKWVMGLLMSDRAHTKEWLAECREVLMSLLSNLTQTHCRLWMSWNRRLSTVLSETRHDTNLSIAEEETRKKQWDGVIVHVKEVWETIVQAPNITAEDVDSDVEEIEGLLDVDELLGGIDPYEMVNPNEDLV
ncbi:uncharacterized protein MELLADRAFT_86737 [Melampsora larici-populina 98AG31]|uniref:Uncharacterized protein n=1 Tax=Melampsora larici-populina (strain 98AG31 / pathotype 3-4-7) TaxID=747676 RepID=F4R376_MELLP|nr:uncharacterized protein MELLADRAFT_86737 [Melampsora larici-populina 98AG31]EGG13217.1 hypothetical protein MELLADRAFT_86737 [Melampsora larici-populina 98AG31]